MLTRILLKLALAWGCATTAAAQIVYVDSTATGANNGSSWANAYTSFEFAVERVSLAGREFWVAGGTYTPDPTFAGRLASFVMSDREVYGGFAGTETSREQRDPISNPTILSGDLNGDDASGGHRTDNCVNVISMNSFGISTRLDGFIVEGGFADGAFGGGSSSGSGLIARGGVIANCVIRNNTATNNGAGVFIDNSGASPTFVNCVIEGNVAGAAGGGVYVQLGTAEFINCAITRNQAADTGGARIRSSANVQFVNSVFSGNSSSSSAALRCSQNATAALINCSVVGNLGTNLTSITGAVAGDGLSLENSIFWNNVSLINDASQASQLQIAGATPINYCRVQGWDATLGGVGNSGMDPKFIAAPGVDGLYGTTDDNLRLQANSSCLDAGNNLALPADAGDLNANGDFNEPLPLDLDLLPRRIDDVIADTGGGSAPIVDIGAFEAARPHFFVTGVPANLPEGTSDVVHISLGLPPSGSTTVSISRVSGDPDITMIPSQLTFGPADYDQPQPVQLNAAEDADFLNGVAAFHVTAVDVATAQLSVTELDNDPIPTVLHVASDASGAGTGADWANAMSDLAAALDAANLAAGAVQELWIKQGVYYSGPTTAPRESTFGIATEVALYGGFAGNETVRSDRDPRQNPTVLSGDLDRNDETGSLSDNSLHVITVECSSAVIIDGVTIVGGNADGDIGDDTQSAGAGIFLIEGELELTNVELERNTANGRGAGLLASTDTTVRLRSVKFARNTALVGGGLAASFATVRALDCQFLDNRAANGAVAFVNLTAGNSAPVFEDCLLIGNASTTDGPITSDVITMRHCTVVDNWSGDNGVGINVGNWSLFPSKIQNTILIGNVDKDGHDDGARLFEMFNNSVGIPDPIIDHTNMFDAWPSSGIANGGLYPRLTASGHLLGSSPTVDAGDPNFLLDPNCPYDLDGDPRIVNARVDIGFDEWTDSDGDQLPDWFEQRYFDPNTIVDPNVDSDGDTLTNLAEYRDHGSNPNAPPLFVDPVLGDNSFDGRSATPDPNSSVGPKQTIQAALNAANDGDSVILAAGVYTGTGNFNLNFDRKLVTVVGAGSGSTTIDCQSAGRAFDPNTLSGFFTTIKGLSIESGLAALGGGARSEFARLRLDSCTLRGNDATEGGGLYTDFSALTIDGLTLGSNTAPTGDSALLTRTSLDMRGDLTLSAGTMEMRSCAIYGPGTIQLAPATSWRIDGSDLSAPPTSLRSDVRGRGDILIAPTQQLHLTHGAVIDLSDGTNSDPNAACNEGFVNWGTITVEGVLFVENAEVRTTNVNVKIACFEQSANILNNNIALLEAVPGFGGEFFVAGDSTITCNVITSEGDRYLDIDPDPDASPRPTINDNLLTVLIKQGAGQEEGELLELRSRDADFGDPNAGDANSGAYQLGSSAGDGSDQGYEDTWVLELLEIEPGAKVNLTNRPGFDFNPGDPNPDAMYVKLLKLHPGAVLNTALQRCYYQQVVDENDQPLGPPDDDGMLSNGAMIVDQPLLGFSLIEIRMEDDTEFAVRIRQRVLDPVDDNPDPDSPVFAGEIERLAAPFDPNNGVMRMKTTAPGKQSATSIAAHGAFARAGDEKVTIIFEYLFDQVSMNPSKPTELIVYMSDAPEASTNLRQVGVVRPPVTGPGSVGSGQLATYKAAFPAADLNFKRGTYIELELRGEDSVVYIDNFDPQVQCTSEVCGDLTGERAIDGLDYHAALGLAGRSLDVDISCELDATPEGYFDLQDVLALNTARTICGSGLDIERLNQGGTPFTPPSDAKLLIAGQRASPDFTDRTDYLFPVRSDDTCAPGRPASGQLTANGRMAVDANGEIHQIHAELGLVRLSDAQLVVTPQILGFGGETVYVGPHDQLNFQYLGLPFSDVAFSVTDPLVLHVVPVVVEPSNFDPNNPSSYRYRAAAQLTLDGFGGYSITALYGVDPQFDPEVNASPPEASSINVQHPREIEVDANGNVFVLAASATGGNNDWLLAYDAANSLEARLNLSDTVRDPSGLLVPALQANTLYVAEGATGTDLLTGRLAKYTWSQGGASEDMIELAGSADIISLDGSELANDPNWVTAVLPTALAEDPVDGTIYVTALAKSDLLSLTGPGLDFNDDDRFVGALAEIPPAAGTSTVPLRLLDCGNLGLPISVLALDGGSTTCGPECDVAGGDADVTDDCTVDLTDLAVLLANFGSSGVSHGDGDTTFDGSVDLTDLANVLAEFGTSCP